ncbi:MAG: lysozyme inhibitor LprI family protein [Rhodanobacter sp.]
MLSVAVFLFAFSAACLAKLPVGLAGTWQVTEVHVNTEATWTMHYGWNDPALRWRIFNFSDALVTADTPESAQCEAPQASITHVTLASLLGKSMAGGEDAQERPTPIGYGFGKPPAKALDVISLSCQGKFWQGGLGADGGLQGAWMYLASDGHLVLRWYDETILVLDRLAADARPQASFDCSKAASPTEKAVCASLPLAAFDRSVAAAYKVARDEVKDDADMTKQVVFAQKAWVHRRDACGTDATCLLESMKKRLGELAAVDQD